MRYAKLRPMVPFDNASMREAFSGPEKQWCSMGLVGFNDKEPIVFDVDQGCPMVKVILHPSFEKVYCRVAASAAGAAGNGEGEWAPFVENDEVLVMLPGGDSKGGAIITHRLNNAIDAFPMDSVAGQDPTTNTFAFVRRRTPFITEIAGPWLVRNATTGAFINISNDGIITLKDGENSAFQISPDVIGIMGPSTETKPPEFILQLDLTHRHFVLQVGDAIMTLSASDGSPEVNTISVPGSFVMGTIGNAAIEHAISTEAVANLVFNWFTTLAAAFTAAAAAPQTGTSIAAIINAWLLAGFPASIAVANFGALPPLVLAAITSAFFSAPPKFSNPLGQANPGIGSAGFNIG